MEEKMVFEDAKKKILDLVGEKHFKAAREELLNFNYADIGEILEDILEEICHQIYRTYSDHHYGISILYIRQFHTVKTCGYHIGKHIRIYRIDILRNKG